jgi:hypothetical protein
MDKRKPTRRDFARTVAGLAAAPLATQEAPAAADPPEPVAAAAEVLTEIVRRRHGTHLTDEQLRRVRQGIERGLHAAEMLRRFPLRNSDEPAFQFSADVP